MKMTNDWQDSPGGDDYDDKFHACNGCGESYSIGVEFQWAPEYDEWYCPNCYHDYLVTKGCEEE
tara:strand:- start:405 stop:596 length:192 start_codon:yes stop_codon:yes gene_type:complete